VRVKEACQVSLVGLWGLGLEVEQQTWPAVEVNTDSDESGNLPCQAEQISTQSIVLVIHPDLVRVWVVNVQARVTGPVVYLAEELEEVSVDIEFCLDGHDVLLSVSGEGERGLPGFPGGPRGSIVLLSFSCPVLGVGTQFDLDVLGLFLARLFQVTGQVPQDPGHSQEPIRQPVIGSQGTRMVVDLVVLVLRELAEDAEGADDALLLVS